MRSKFFLKKKSRLSIFKSLTFRIRIIIFAVISVFVTGKGSFRDDTMLLLHRDGYVEECYFSFTLSPLFMEDGTVGGVFNAVQETTQRVLAVRRLRALGDLGNRTPGICR